MLGYLLIVMVIALASIVAACAAINHTHEPAPCREPKQAEFRPVEDGTGPGESDTKDPGHE